MLLAATLMQGPTQLEMNDTKNGTGAAAKVGDTVVVHYTGKLTNGKVFDSSRGSQPFTFVLGDGQVIRGWDEGLVGMKKGGKRTLRIPPSMGYGEQGSPPVIPANATLIFDVELVSIEKITVKVLKPGSGPAVKEGDSITVKYAGSLKNGKRFDSGSLDVEVGTTGLIKGFTQGLIGMKMGEKRRVTIPPALGYGDRSVGDGLIPANSTLIFDLELVKRN
jgi:FKBP-type peptidyl-prolyl cis-trans isomerase